MAYWLDEGWHGWPEIVRAGTAAAGLYARCGSYIADHTTDGLIPTEVARMYGTAEWVQKLVGVGLWTVEGDGYRDTRYFPLNPSSEVIAKRKADAADRQRRLRNGKRTRESRVTDTVTSAVTKQPRAPSPPLKGGLGGVGGSGGCAGFVDDGNGWCTECSLPKANKTHFRSKQSALPRRSEPEESS